MTQDAIRDMLLTARQQAWLANAVYYGRVAVGALAETQRARFRNIKVANHDVALLVFPDHVHMSIAGTNDRYDWAANTHTEFVELDGMQVHSGYADAAQWIANELNDCNILNLISDKRLYIGGHSAGGAIAEMLPLVDARYRPSGTYTFGSPKWCGTDSAARYMSQPWTKIRFTMPLDPVPYLPPSLWRVILRRPTFSHVSVGVELRDSGEWGFVDDFQFAAKIASFGFTLWSGTLATVASLLRSKSIGLESHGANRYVRAIELAVRKHEGAE